MSITDVKSSASASASATVVVPVMWTCSKCTYAENQHKIHTRCQVCEEDRYMPTIPDMKWCVKCQEMYPQTQLSCPRCVKKNEKQQLETEKRAEETIYKIYPWLNLSPISNDTKEIGQYPFSSCQQKEIEYWLRAEYTTNVPFTYHDFLHVCNKQVFPRMVLDVFPYLKPLFAKEGVTHEHKQQLVQMKDELYTDPRFLSVLMFIMRKDDKNRFFSTKHRMYHMQKCILKNVFALAKQVGSNLEPIMHMFPDIKNLVEHMNLTMDIKN